MKKYLFIIPAFILLQINMFSVNNPTENITITPWDEYQLPDSGATLIDITVTIPVGNHIYIDHLKADSRSILAAFSISEESGVKLMDTIIPVGEVMGKDIIMKGSRVFQLKVQNTIKREDKEKAVIPFEFKVQMCNDVSGICYIPYTFKREINVIFQKRSKTQKSKMEGGINWVYRHANGVDEAERLNKYMFVLITAPEWCGACQHLEATTLRDDTVIEFINSNFIPVMIKDTIDGERNPDLWTYDFEGYPTYLVTTAGKEVLYQDAGTVSPSILLADLKEYEIKKEDNPGRIVTKDMIQKIKCAVKFDDTRGLAVMENGKYVIFNLDDKSMDSKYPLSISQTWVDIMPYAHKIIYGLNYLNDKYYIFLSDKRYLRFSEGSLSLDPGYPKSVDSKTWPGLAPYADNVEAALVWKKNNKVYFFTGNGTYLRYDKNTNRVDSGYPKDINDSTWPGLGPYSKNITSAFSHGRGFSYFLLNTGGIVKYDNKKDKVVEGPGDATGTGEVITADDTTFYPLTENKLAFVDFYADWCGPCKEFAPVFKHVAEKIPNGLFIKINVDTCPGLCNDFQIEWIPYVVAVYNGEVLGEVPWEEEAFMDMAKELMKKYD